MQHYVSMNVVTKSDLGWSAAFDMFTKLALDHGENFAQVTVSSAELDFQDEVEPDTEPSEEYFDDSTMMKVYDAIRPIMLQIYRDEGFSGVMQNAKADSACEDIVNSLQNAGIKFREIRQS